MLLSNSLFVAVGCFLLAADKNKQLNLPGCPESETPSGCWRLMRLAWEVLDALRDNRSAPILERFTDTNTGMCLNMTGSWTGISSYRVTWKNSTESRPTRNELDGFLLALQQEWNQTQTQSSKTSPEQQPISPEQPSTDTSQPGIGNDANKTRNVIDFALRMFKRLNESFGSWYFNNTEHDDIMIEDITTHTQMLLGGLVLGVGAIVGQCLLVLLALLLVLHIVRKRRIARDQHYDWGFNDAPYYQQSPRTPAVSGLATRSQQTRRAGAGGRQLSALPKQALYMHNEPAGYTPLEELDANSAHATLNASLNEQLPAPADQYQSALLIAPGEPQLQATNKQKPDVNAALLRTRDSQW